MRLRWVHWRSVTYIWYREFRFRGFRWANRRMWGWKFGRM